MNYTKDDILDREARLVFSDFSNERSIICIAFKNEDAFYTLVSRVTEDDFLLDETRNLFIILKTLHAHGIKGFDPQIILRMSSELIPESNFSLDYLEALFNATVNESNFDKYIDKLLDDSTKFKLYNKLITNTNFVYENAKNISSLSSNDLLSKAQSELLSLSITSSYIDEPIHVADGLEDYIEAIKDNKVDLIGLSTGFPMLDKAIDGLIPGTLMIIAARKKMGKSAFLTNVAANVAVLNNKATLYVDTEMTFEEWRSRILAIISGVDERVIKHGGFAKIDKIYDRVMRSVEILKKCKLFHFYMPGYTVEKLSALYEKYKYKEDISLGIFDYIKEPDLSSVDGGRKEHQILGDVTTKLKDLAGRLNIPFLAAVQLNRSGDVADSDRIARYGDVIAFWGLRDLKAAEENGWDLDIAGHYSLCIKDSRRGGRTGEAGIGYKFWKSKVKIIEVPIHEQIESVYDADSHIDVGSLGDSDDTDELK